ncbi:MAG: DUF5696 domain-containing protein [Verrucomicrobiota bacterium]
MKNRFKFMKLLGLVAACLAASSAHAELGRVTLDIVEQYPEALIKKGDPGTEVATTGVENGLLLKVAGKYHFFTSIWMDAVQIGSTFGNGYWTSPDGIKWRLEKVLQAPGRDRTGEDVRTLFWEPIPVYDSKAERWNLIYMSGRWVGPKAMALGEKGTGKWDGRPWRAVSKTKGLEGIGGPWKELGEIDHGPYDPWEGRQYIGEWGSTSTWFPYACGDRWMAMYGSHRGWQVGLAEAQSLQGPWKRLSRLNPLTLSGGYGNESPRVFRLKSGRYLCLFNVIKDMRYPDPKMEVEFTHPMFSHLGMGYSDSADGVHWSESRFLMLKADDKLWCKQMRTPVGFIEEPDGTYTLYYTAMTDGFFKGFEGLGRVRVSVTEEKPLSRPVPVAAGDDASSIKLENPYLILQVDKSTGLAKVTDRRTGTVYTQMPAFDLNRISDVRLAAKEDGREIETAFTFDRIPTTLSYRLLPESPELEVSVDLPPDPAIKSVPLPVPFTVADQGFEWVVPEGYGMLYAVDNPSMPQAAVNGELQLGVFGSSLSAWMGLVQPKSGAGYALIFKDPHAVEAALKLTDTGDRKALVARIDLLPERGKFSGKRSFKYIFQAKGGPVALAKNYRAFLQDNGWYKSLAEQRRDDTAIENLRGAPVFRIVSRFPGTGTAEATIKVVDDLHRSGIQRAIIELGSPELFERAQVQAMERHGYVVQFSDHGYEYAQGLLAGRCAEVPGLMSQARYQPAMNAGWEPMTPTRDYADFAMAHRKRVPVTGVVIGDARVSTWAWPDANNRVAGCWLKKDLFNILYGTAPSYVFDPVGYWKDKDEILKSCARVSEVYRKIFGAALVSHRWLTEDRNVQQVEFSNGWAVIVNFGDMPYKAAKGNVVPPMSCHLFTTVL